jgi:RHS repeat-associated protein
MRAAAISAAYDYYPVGMLMPNRYHEVQNKQCMLVKSHIMHYSNVPIIDLNTEADQGKVLAATTITWNNFGKIKKILTNLLEITYLYEATGNRVAKRKKTLNASIVNTTTTDIYVRDASGNQLLGQTLASSGWPNVFATLNTTEQHMYGSARLGVAHVPTLKYDGLLTKIPTITGMDNTKAELTRMLSYRHNNTQRYELTDHLGKVRHLFSDVANSNVTGTDTNLNCSNLQAKQLAMYNYYAFGSPKANKFSSSGAVTQATESWDDADYRYGFNGQEKDNEIKGIGNSLDFGARVYDSRLGRWLSLDKKGSKYPMDAPFISFGNNPIAIIDPDGNEKIAVAASDHHDNSFKFVQSALRALCNYPQSTETKTLLLVNNDNYYSPAMIKDLQAIGKLNGFAVIEVKTMSQVIGYINGAISNVHGNNRYDDLITQIDIFAHGTTSTIHSDYDNKGNTTINNKNFENICPESFSSGALFTSYACRTGASNDLPKTNELPLNSNPSYQVNLNGSKSSLAQNLANHLGIKVDAFMARTEYANNLGKSDVERRTNSVGYSYLLEQGILGTKYGRHVGYLRDAVYPVQGSTSTSNVSSLKYRFEKINKK